MNLYDVLHIRKHHKFEGHICGRLGGRSRKRSILNKSIDILKQLIFVLTVRSRSAMTTQSAVIFGKNSTEKPQRGGLFIHQPLCRKLSALIAAKNFSLSHGKKSIARRDADAGNTKKMSK
jgi:hypothetical protein